MISREESRFIEDGARDVKKISRNTYEIIFDEAKARVERSGMFHIIHLTRDNGNKTLITCSTEEDLHLMLKSIAGTFIYL